MAQKKIPTAGLLLAGLAAVAYYKYSKMTPEDKDNLIGDLKAKGQKLYDEYMPEQYKSMFSSKADNTGTASASSHYDEGNAFTR